MVDAFLYVFCVMCLRGFICSPLGVDVGIGGTSSLLGLVVLLLTPSPFSQLGRGDKVLRVHWAAWLGSGLQPLPWCFEEARLWAVRTGFGRHYPFPVLSAALAALVFAGSNQLTLTLSGGVSWGGAQDRGFGGSLVFGKWG